MTRSTATAEDNNGNPKYLKVDETGRLMVSIVSETREDFNGSDADGSAGDSGRTITLSNTATTQDTKAYKSGLLLSNDDVTITNLASSSTVQINVPLWDDEHITVIYNV